MTPAMKPNCHCSRYLSFYSKFAAALLLLGASNAFGITLNGVYFGTCERDIGVLINVDASRIQLLTLSGTVKSISRFDIIYLAEYPLGNIPIRAIQNADAKPVTIVNTLVDFEPRELVRGWPIDFSDQSILFLTTDGDELVIAREDVYTVETAADIAYVELKNAIHLDFYYHYPALFNHCQSDRKYSADESAGNEVYPQQLIGNPLLIKSSLDELMAGHKLVQDYKRNQQFYAVPGIYSNDTRIGLWYNLNSRHGASDARNNSVIPFIISDFSDGPFGFQRRITTGSGLMSYSVHEEPQTLFSYALKADYFHFSVMFDPSAILTGSNYLWKKKELYTHDDRIMESFHLAAGFDWRQYALEIAIPNYTIGVRNGEYFANDSAAMFRYGLAYRNQFIDTQLYLGRGASSSKDEDSEDDQDAREDEANTRSDSTNRLTTARINLALNYFVRVRPVFSLIYRKYTFQRDPDMEGYGAFNYESSSLTHYFALDYGFANDITVSGYVSAELNEITYGSDMFGPGSSNRQNYKSGVSIMLTF